MLLELGSLEVCKRNELLVSNVEKTKAYNTLEDSSADWVIIWFLVNPRWMKMDGSSESAWHESDSSRRLSTSGVSDRTTDLLRVEGFGISHNFESRKESDRNLVAYSDEIQNQVGASRTICDHDLALGPFVRSLEWGEVSLRQWLDKPDRSVDAFECLHTFRQIVEIVNVAHSQGIVVHNVRPSCFVMSSFNHVSFIESASCSDSGSDSAEDGLNSQTKLQGEDFQLGTAHGNATSVVGYGHSSSDYPRQDLFEETEDNKALDRSAEQVEEKKQPFPMKQILAMETSWYTSPEELGGGPSTCASDVYRLGVLLFELFCPSSLRDEKMTAMSSLRHRVLPPQILLKWPKEASFCLWLLHPDPSCRPKMGELLRSEFLNEQRENLEEREAAMVLRERIEEQELLLEFLVLIQQRKQESADKLHKTVSFLLSDVEDVMKQQALQKKGSSHLDQSKGDQTTSENEDSSSLFCRKRYKQGLWFDRTEKHHDDADDARRSDADAGCHQTVLLQNSRLMKNFRKLESAYFLTRCRQIKPPGRSMVRQSPLSSSVSTLSSKEHSSDGGREGWIHPFLEGLCKYLSYSKLEVKADLKQGDLLNSSNLVCSIAFDRDGEFFATAGVNKKIKVFECHTVMNETRDIHYPVVEMSSRSKLSSLCWNKYIKSKIASSNFEGVVQVWDATRNQVLAEMREHEKRVWSVDFSSADPTLLASGSDDGSVKLWSINQGVSVGTIKTNANVCCVQFPSDSGRSLAFGSADHRVYYYDLRNSKTPLCTLNGHNKTVSYVKFVDPMTLVSASTDNTLKLWDLSMCAYQVNDVPIQSFTGHTNMKNFVGLAVSDGYIATGSETNEVFVYHKALPMPALSFKFINTDPISGHDMEDSSQFISSVCWRGQSSTLVAANSTGNIKILEMV